MRRLIQATAFTTLLLIVLSCGNKKIQEYSGVDEMIEDAKASIAIASPEELKEAIEQEKDFYLIDVREKVHYDSASIPGAIHIPRGLLEFQIATKAHDHRAPMIVFCEDGSKSALAAATLPQLKYAHVKSLEGGFDAWKKQYPDLVEDEPAGDGQEQNVPAAPSGGGCGG
ncbi:MAG: rhodanese-like domain-containing protein [Bacteroidales bacterium]